MRPVILTIFIVFTTAFLSVNGTLSEKEQHADNKFLENVDKIMKSAWELGSVAKYAEAKNLLIERCDKSCSSSNIPQKLARCFYYLSELDKDTLSKDDKYALIKEGCKYAEMALKINIRDPEAHKWMGILSGHRGNFEGGFAKVRGGILFYEHINRALELAPEDAELYFLKGFIEHEIGKIGRFQRNAASKIFPGFPNVTTKDAIKSFQRAIELNKLPRKIFSANLAACYYEDKNLGFARKWLKIAEEIDVKNNEDKQAEIIIAKVRKSLKN